MIKKAYILIAFSCLLFFGGIYYLFSAPLKQSGNPTDKTLNIYTWADFISPDLQKEFEAQTGIKLHIDYMDSDEALEAKLLTGKSEYDLVYPSTPYVFRHIKMGLYKPLDLRKIPNIKNIDTDFLDDFKENDTIYSIPYLWASSGYAYNVEVFNEAFPSEEIDGWEYMFNPEKLKKIASKGVATISSAYELFGALGFWKGYSPENTPDNFIETAADLAKKARPYWHVFLSSDAAIQALGAGEVAIAFIWNGDAIVSQILAETQGRKIQYVTPKEGTYKGVDGLAIPCNSSNPDAAHQFINFLLKAENMAHVTNRVRFANTSSLSKKFILPEIVNNPILYPAPHIMKRIKVNRQINSKNERRMNRQFFKILVGY